MNHELIERYIYAVTRHLPLKMRADVKRELEGLISDMLEERCGAVLPAEKDVRIVLTELGTSEVLAAKYSDEEKQALISGSFLLIYKRVLKIVLPIMAAVVFFGSLMSLIFNTALPQNPYELVGLVFAQTIGTAFSSVLSAFAIITIVFAVLERKKATIPEGDMFAHLPLVPEKETRIKRHDPIMGIVWAVIATVLFLVFPWFAGVWVKNIGWIPFFLTTVIRSHWLPITLWGILSISKESFKLIEGQYTKRLAIATVAANLSIAICAAVVFVSGSIVNPDFLPGINSLIETGDGQVPLSLFSNVHLFLLSIVCIGLIIDSAIASAKA